jgi:hypothetical protein
VSPADLCLWPFRLLLSDLNGVPTWPLGPCREQLCLPLASVESAGRCGTGVAERRVFVAAVTPTGAVNSAAGHVLSSPPSGANSRNEDAGVIDIFKCCKVLHPKDSCLSLSYSCAAISAPHDTHSANVQSIIC